MEVSRRSFFGSAVGFAVAGGSQLVATGNTGAINCAPPVSGATSCAPPVSDAQKRVPPWKKGEFQIHLIYTGVGESQFLIFPDGTTMLLDCPGNPAVNLGRDAVPILPSAKLHAGEWVARYVARVNPNKTDVDYMALSHFHQDHGGGISYHKGVTKWKGGEYYRSGFALAAEKLKFRKAIDRTGPTFDDFMKDYSAPGATMKNLEQLYRHLMERDGLVLEKFRLGATDQVVPLHGGCEGFSVFNVLGNGMVAKPDGGTVDLFNGNYDNLKKMQGFENPLSVGYVFRYGAFSYGTFGDFNARASDGKLVEKKAAPFMPRVTVAKMNHHGCGGSHPRVWVEALAPKVWIGAVWHQHHVDPYTLAKLGTINCAPPVAGGSRSCATETDLPLLCPTVFPSERRIAAILAHEPWLPRVVPASFRGGHVVVTVPPGGKTFTVRYLDAGDEKMSVAFEKEILA
ncbi:MAG: MBL fold metallo-hydrolase [Kiritimatiellae bacterium]|nr:MBL fold metallo-hydrolase [Kiritimatiellia bacterium]